ncbi:MAG: hypothetical protein M0R77_00810 [Gammaproteobacteria bacterium]|nr:hypothetical protein [Acholeplasmataceae bacterium]MCK9529095.1 hypothetical protein [Gammaproteobacteria bacterium]
MNTIKNNDSLNITNPKHIYINATELTDFITSIFLSDINLSTWWAIIGFATRREVLTDFVKTALATDDSTSIDSLAIQELYAKINESMINPEIIEAIVINTLDLIIDFILNKYPNNTIDNLSNYRVSVFRFDTLILERIESAVLW